MRVQDFKGFFNKKLKKYSKESSLNPAGRKIIECCFEGGSLNDFEETI